MTVAPLNAATPSSSLPVYTASARAGRVLLGRTLPSLLDEACRNNPNPKALNEPTDEGWRSISSPEFRAQAEALALALRETGLERGERVAFFTHSDLSFCLPDMACLMAGLVTVPIYLTQDEASARLILQETGAQVLVVSDAALLATVTPYLTDTAVRTLLVRDPAGAAAPAGTELVPFETLLARGRALLAENPEAGRVLRGGVRAGDLATIIYTSGTTGTPKGVMLSHENMSSNVMAAFTGIPQLRRGQEVAVSFLPLTHVFARTLHYGLLAWGAAVYFTTPERLRDHLKDVKPTMFATVPRVLERVFEGILKAGADLSGVKKPIFDWAVALARRFEPERDGGPVYSTQRRAAAKLVFDRWREAMGGRLGLVIAGGAAVRPELVRVFGAAGVTVLQGYGLTETGPVVAFNRPDRNRPGTVGELLPGTEAKLTKQGELLARGPQVMLGYYNNPGATAAAVDADGWFHTGDLAEITDGFVTITGRLKNLFKLSTGKYVTPAPLEAALEAHPAVEHALVVGEGEKHPAALLFLAPGCEPWALRSELTTALQMANQGMPKWTQAKCALVLSDPLTIANGLLTPTLKVKRNLVLKRYHDDVRVLFGHAPAGDACIIESEAKHER